MRDSEERFKVLFEYAPDAIYLSDHLGNFIDGNKAAEEITGYKREELIGKSFLKLNLLFPAQIIRAAALLAQNVVGKSTGPDELMLNRKDGTQVAIEIRTYPVRIKDKVFVLGIARDISERKKAEEEKEKHLRELEIFYKATIDREEKMLELKKRIKELEEKLSIIK